MIARVLALCLLTSPAYALESPQPQGPITSTDSVSLEIREPNGPSKKITGISWTLRQTVLDVMKTADGIKFTAEWYKSLGQWMVISIDGKQNAGAGGSFWGLCVDGQPAMVGADSYVVGPKAAIVWVYGSKYPPACPSAP